MIPKNKRMKSKKLTDSAKYETCIRCGKQGETRACHYNGQRQHYYGKGRGVKCHDIATAEFCHDCDQVFSEGNMQYFFNKTEKSEEFLHWVMMTNIRRIQNNVVNIK